MLIVETAFLMPHVCGRCKETKSPLVDTLVDWYEGRLYVCRECAEEMARLHGVLRPFLVEALELRADIARLEEELETERELRAQEQQAVVMTLQHGAVTNDGRIVPRQRRPRKKS